MEAGAFSLQTPAGACVCSSAPSVGLEQEAWPGIAHVSSCPESLPKSEKCSSPLPRASVPISDEFGSQNPGI